MAPRRNDDDHDEDEDEEEEEEEDDDDGPVSRREHREAMEGLRDALTSSGTLPRKKTAKKTGTRAPKPRAADKATDKEERKPRKGRDYGSKFWFGAGADGDDDDD